MTKEQFVLGVASVAAGDLLFCSLPITGATVRHSLAASTAPFSLARSALANTHPPASATSLPLTHRGRSPSCPAIQIAHPRTAQRRHWATTRPLAVRVLVRVFALPRPPPFKKSRKSVDNKSYCTASQNSSCFLICFRLPLFLAQKLCACLGWKELCIFTDKRTT